MVEPSQCVPHLGHQCLAADRDIRLGRETGQQVELLGTQAQFASGHGDPASRNVDDEIAEPADLLRGPGRGVVPTQVGAQARVELGQPDGFDQIVVGARVQPDRRPSRRIVR